MRLFQNGLSIHLVVLFLASSFLAGISQEASIKVEERTFRTYPFSDPNSIPILTTNPKIYPYHKYEGYSHEAVPKDWQVVKMENDWVEVFVLPQVGGKVWGAIEKSTGHEFIYRNEVMKFRNIAMRGPWTSGGIEFNFGIIGHHPSTATPVDHIVQEHDDGSVSCTVGNIDLSSRTQWRVKIVLPPDKAYFETQASWYNPTSTGQSYYNWMTAAAPALQDFVFYTPGDQYLKHSGQALPWPIDAEGRNLSFYNENNFGPSKSYHVVGAFNDFFGGYYNDAQYGFGHWSEYEEMPGQKLWLWALSRSGGIWEDLLTDTDGQYIEFQAGRLFVQYAPDDHGNPVTQANFEPHASDLWREIWFPVKSIGGLSDASEKAVMHVQKDGNTLTIGINAFQSCSGKIEVIANDEVLFSQPVQLSPMEDYSRQITLDLPEDYEIKVDELDLHFYSNPKVLKLDRPFHQGSWPSEISSGEKLYRAGMEDVKFRLYESGLEKFRECLVLDPFHSDAMVAIADIYYRKGLNEAGLRMAKKALKLDTYDPDVNYVAGNLYRGLDDRINAKEAFGWAARSLKYRSSGFAQIAELWLMDNELQKAKKYAGQSLDFNRYNVSALMVLAIVARIEGLQNEANEYLKEILKIDPLNHFAHFENYLNKKSGQSKETFQMRHRSEFPIQTYLELAIAYHNIGRNVEAIGLLEMAPQHPLIDLWYTFIQHDPNSHYFGGITNLSPDFVFPFRRETMKALAWAVEHSDHWKFKYYLALNLWGKGRKQEAAELLKMCGNSPDFDVFYQVRAHLLSEVEEKDMYNDLLRALNLDREDHRNWRSLIHYYQETENDTKALHIGEEAYQVFTHNYAIGMDVTRSLIALEQYSRALSVLDQVNVLPFEGASEGRTLYEKACYGRSLELIHEMKYADAINLLERSKSWPENLGVGKPYDPEERVANFLTGYCYDQLGQSDKAVQYYQLAKDQFMERMEKRSKLHLLGLKAIERTDGKAEAEIYLNSLLNTSHGKSPITLWVRRSYRGQTSIQDGVAYNPYQNDRIFRDICNLLN